MIEARCRVAGVVSIGFPARHAGQEPTGIRLAHMQPNKFFLGPVKVRTVGIPRGFCYLVTSPYWTTPKLPIDTIRPIRSFAPCSVVRGFSKWVRRREPLSLLQ